MPADVVTEDLPAEPTFGRDVLGTQPSPHRQRTGRRSSSRRLVGLVGQYALLVVLALLVLVPIVFTLIQALSPPFTYLAAGKPLHPVAVDWKDRSWFDGGAFSVVARTLVVVAGAGMGAAQGRGRRRPGNLSPLASPRRSVAVRRRHGGDARCSPARSGSRSSSGPATTVLWFLLTIGVVAADPARRVRRRGRRLGARRPRRARSRVGPRRRGRGRLRRVGLEPGVGPGQPRSGDGPKLRGHGAHHRCPGGHLDPGRLRLRLPALPVQDAWCSPCSWRTLLLPLEVTLLANVQTIRELGWVNSNAALVLPFAATAFGTFLIRQGFRGVPPEIHDATRLDGYGHLRFLWRFAVPLTRPVIASFTVIAALGAWNQYLWPQAVIDDDRYQTAQIRLKTIVGTEVDQANTPSPPRSSWPCRSCCCSSPSNARSSAASPRER